jgi:hypothetical protein
MNIGIIGASSLGFANYGAYVGASSSEGSVFDGLEAEGIGASTDKVEGKDPNARPGFKSSPENCETCRERKYQDGSDENVSFKAPAHVSPQAAGAAVRAHEGEHVSNAYKKAAMEGGKVIHAGVSIHTAVCPECGRTYVSGGTTNTTLSLPKDGQKKDPYKENAKSLLNDIGVGAKANYAV